MSGKNGVQIDLIEKGIVEPGQLDFTIPDGARPEDAHFPPGTGFGRQVRVSDNGIAQGIQARQFEPFAVLPTDCRSWKRLDADGETRGHPERKIFRAVHTDARTELDLLVRGDDRFQYPCRRGA